MAMITALLLAQQLAATPLDIAAVAAASPRPQVCARVHAVTHRRATVWDRARSPEQGRFCSELARGYALLNHSPEKALVAARNAAKQWKRQAAPLVLEARVHVVLGNLAEAHALFQKALERDPNSLADPTALHDRARAAVAVGERGLAADAYRKLVPRVGLMPLGPRRRTALIEASVLAMQRGPSGIDEALGYLGEARRQSRVAGAEGFLFGALALALDRQGRAQEARGVAAEAGGHWVVARQAPLPSAAQPSSDLAPTLPLLPREESYAVVAMLAEAEHPKVARQYWQACLDANPDGGPWREHAARKLAELSR